MHTAEVDERTTRWEISSPCFRVTFTDREHGDATVSYRVGDAGLVEVRDWVASVRGDRGAVLSVEVEDGDGLGLVVLETIDGAAGTA